MPKAKAMDKFTPNDKTQIAMEPTGKLGEKAFMERLTSDELAALKDLRASEPELTAEHPSSFLMKFIWARKLDVRRAAEVLRDHMEWRQEWDLENLDLKAVEAYLHSGLCYWVPGLYSRQGYSASFMVPRNFDLELWKKLGSRGMMHAVYYVTDMASDHDIEIARQGTVVVLDFAGASWNEIMRAIKGEGDFDLGRILESGQNHMPSRVRDVILVNPPWWVRLLLGLVKPLLKNNLRKKIHSCKSSELGNYFTPENMLEEWGGVRKFDKDEWADSVLAHRPTLSEGKYIDPSARSEEAIRGYTGQETIGTVHGVSSISKSLSQPEPVEAQ